MSKGKSKKRKATGDCYEAALNFALSIPDDERDAYRVVHGYPIGQGAIEGIKHGHAWVERTDAFPDNMPEQFKNCAADLFIVCIDKSNGKDLELPRCLYYGYGNIYADECHYYTVEEAITLAVKSGHYGSWAEAPADAVA